MVEGIYSQTRNGNNDSFVSYGPIIHTDSEIKLHGPEAQTITKKGRLHVECIGNFVNGEFLSGSIKFGGERLTVGFRSQYPAQTMGKVSSNAFKDVAYGLTFSAEDATIAYDRTKVGNVLSSEFVYQVSVAASSILVPGLRGFLRQLSSVTRRPTHVTVLQGPVLDGAPHGLNGEMTERLYKRGNKMDLELSWKGMWNKGALTHGTGTVAVPTSRKPPGLPCCTSRLCVD